MKNRLEWAGDRGHLVVHALLPIVLVAVGAQLGSIVAASNPSNCRYQDVNGLPVDYLPDWSLVIVGLIGLVAGRNLSRFSQRREYATSPRSESVVQWTMVAVFAAMTAVWFYQAIGVARVSASALGATEFEPITYYIRCAIYHDKAANGGIAWWTMFVVFVVCGLVGHWLWSEHPALSRMRARKRQQETTLA